MLEKTLSAYMFMAMLMIDVKVKKITFYKNSMTILNVKDGIIKKSVFE